jgi:hypothetical protein
MKFYNFLQHYSLCRKLPVFWPSAMRLEAVASTVFAIGKVSSAHAPLHQLLSKLRCHVDISTPCLINLRKNPDLSQSLLRKPQRTRSMLLRCAQPHFLHAIQSAAVQSTHSSKRSDLVPFQCSRKRCSLFTRCKSDALWQVDDHRMVHFCTWTDDL